MVQATRGPRTIRRYALALLAALLALGASAPVAAQEEGCTRQEPCPWPIDVDAAGFVRDGMPAGGWNFTVGMWLQLSVLNEDDAAHTLVLAGLGLRLEAPAGDMAQSQPFNLSSAGTFEVVDEPSGDRLTYSVLRGDVVDAQQGYTDADGNLVSSAPPTGSSTGAPATATTAPRGLAAVPLAVLVLALAALALARRPA